MHETSCDLSLVGMIEEILTYKYYLLVIVLTSSQTHATQIKND